ncbi:hypothetical protein Goshw_016999 [Gossypium schwendimanii]|uniref:NB-ARC domain-containing protein n=1 Tax=Gossypium schwendimanii TaxID=34291 RepID=A0A7J9MIH9_GOSSC|nr:hypothetical protein [Gossypium schwendimanii]
MPKQEVERWFEKVVQKLGHAQDVEDKIRGLVVNDPSTIAVNLPTPEVVGATNVREEIYQYLMGDAVESIAVWGMGGIGKTTIMKDVHNRLLKESKFRKLIWVTVSEVFDIRKLQKDIASQLERNLSPYWQLFYIL